MPSSPLVRIALTAAVTVAIGCGAPAPDAVTRRDSLGIEIVENPRLAEAPATVVFATTSVFDVGGLSDNPDLELPPKGMHDAMRIASGAVIVSSAYELRLYSADGTLLRTLGRKGEGPGEFTSQIWGLCRLGRDTVLALEVPAPRLGVTDVQLTSLTTMTYEGTALPRACTPTGILAAVGEVDYPDDGSSPMVEVASIAADGRVLRGIGRLPADDHRTIFAHEAGVAAGAGFVATTDGLTFEYRQYREDGTLARIVRTADAVRLLDRAAITDLLTEGSGPDLPAAMLQEGVDRTMAGRSRVPFPPFVRIQVHEAGQVWLSEIRPSGNQLQRWFVFDSTGVLLASADPQQALPPGTTWATVVRWTDRELVLHYRDADGAGHVRTVPYTLQAVAAR